MFSCTAHLLYKYCTNCTVCNWTVVTVIALKLLLHVQLHTSTAHLLYKYCTNCTVHNWIVLTVITQELLIHVQLHNSRAHLLYKLYILQLNCTYSNYTEAAATCSAAQQHKNCLALFCSGLQLVVWNCICLDNHIHSSDSSKNSHDWKRSATTLQS